MSTHPWNNHPQSETQPRLPDEEVQNIAHDLNNDLNVACGYVELLTRKSGAQSPDYAYLVEVQDALRNARDRVRRLQYPSA